MNVDTASEILKEHQNSNKWGQSVIFDTGVNIIDLSICFGPNPTQPPKNKCSPSNPKQTTFKFDKSKYKGEDSLPTLIEDLRSACIGCNLHWQKGTVGKIQTIMSCVVTIIDYLINSICLILNQIDFPKLVRLWNKKKTWCMLFIFMHDQ